MGTWGVSNGNGVRSHLFLEAGQEHARRDRHAAIDEILKGLSHDGGNSQFSCALFSTAAAVATPLLEAQYPPH